MTADEYSKVITALTALAAVIVAGVSLVWSYKFQSNPIRLEFVKKQHVSAELLLVKLYDTFDSLSGLIIDTFTDWPVDQDQLFEKPDSSIGTFFTSMMSLEKLIMVHGVYFSNRTNLAFNTYVSDAYETAVACLSSAPSKVRATLAVNKRAAK